MNNLSLTEACLLDVSGELAPPARQALYDYISQNPDAGIEYEAIRAQFELLGALPIHEPSAVRRREIPAQVKLAIHALLQRQAREKRVARFKSLRRYALGAMTAIAACVILVASLWAEARRESATRQQQVATINAIIHRAELSRTEPAVPPREPDYQADSADRLSMADVFESAVALPIDLEERGTSDLSSPPGSY